MRGSNNGRIQREIQQHLQNTTPTPTRAVNTINTIQHKE